MIGYVYTLLIILFIFQSTPAKSYLSINEEKKIIHQYAPPQNLKLKLDLFFSDTLVQSFFKDRPISVCTPRSLKSQLTKTHKRLITQKESQYLTHWKNHNGNIFSLICQKYKITNMTPFHKKVLIFTSEELFPEYVLKILNKEVLRIFPNNQFEYTYLKNISRVLLNAKLQEFANKHNAQYLQVLKKYLYHIPWQPYDLSDNNYIVIAQRICTMPSTQESKNNFKQMLDDKTLRLKKSYILMMKELLKAVFYAGISDLIETNLLFFYQNNQPQFIISDTERDGYTDSNEHFFHKDHAEIYNSMEKALSLLTRRIFDIHEDQEIQFINHLKEVGKIPLTLSSYIKSINKIKNSVICKKA